LWPFLGALVLILSGVGLSFWAPTLSSAGEASPRSGVPLAVAAGGACACSNPGTTREAPEGLPFAERSITVTFSPSGLPRGVTWSLSLDGRTDSAEAPRSIVFADLPAGSRLAWSPRAESGAPGTRFLADPSATTVSAGFSSDSSVLIPFVTQYEVNISSVPSLPGPATPSPVSCDGTQFEWDDPVCPEVDYSLFPSPGIHWVDAGTALAFNASSTSYYCANNCTQDVYLNLSFLSWSGSGSGSANLTSNFTTVRVNGPVNESANFRYEGFCNATPSNPVPLTCTDANLTLQFDELGLPSGVPWSVSTWTGPFAPGALTTASSGSSQLAVNGTPATGVVNFLAWSIPRGSGGTAWIARSDPASPVELPGDRVVNVTYAAAGVDASSFPVLLEAVGLPTASTEWSIAIDGNALGEALPDPMLELPGGRHAFAATTVYSTDGLAYQPSELELLPLWENSSVQNLSGSTASVTLDGPAVLFVEYSLLVRLTVAAGPGGTVAPDDEWVRSGAPVSLVATPAVGYSFVAWQGWGNGSGASGAGSRSLVIYPVGPVQELATFAPVAPVRFTVTVNTIGLPFGENFSVLFNGSSFAGVLSCTLPPVIAGEYRLSVPTVHSNLTEGARFLPVALASTLPLGPGGELQIEENGTVTVTFQEQFSLQVLLSGSGTIDPAPGVYWVSMGSAMPIRAQAGAVPFVAWVGWGNGSVSANSSSITVLPTGPVTELAEFASAPSRSSAGYSLTVREVGLPPDSSWALVGPGSVLRGSGTTLLLTGLNGSAEVGVPTVPGTVGVRYVPADNGSWNLTILANETLNVTFETQYSVTVLAGPGGTVRPLPTWGSAGSSVTLTAVPEGPDWKFVNWTGTAYSGRALSTTVVLLAPLSEEATFAPTATSSSPSGFLSVEIVAGLAATLLIASGIGYRLARGRAGPEDPASEGPPAPSEDRPDDSAESEPLDPQTR
jgi:hypothetical protein